ncbi:MAG: LptF/LptG family permease [Candidatus Euphemobacter frigidus]|nr:LptF/LptG family permease [Candidatus Euphemobacter frigidus]MDP8276592.1 LptF/LptG family permease [Candidatus Euphemobacter frigidus]
MKIIQRYIGKSVAGTFLITLLVLTGILCLGNLIKVADLILKGMDPILILRFFGFLVVGLLEYAIPMAILTATILVFGRLSADNEITGMRASGIGLFPITAPVFFFAFVLMLFCVYLQNTVIPTYGFAIRKLKAEFCLQDPDVLLQPGEIITFPGYTISFDKKEDGVLYKVQINQYNGDDLASAIFAKRALIEFDRDREGFTLKLYDGTAEEIIDRANPEIRTHTTFGEFSYPISLKELYEESLVRDKDKRKKDMTWGELRKKRLDLILETELLQEIITERKKDMTPDELKLTVDILHENHGEISNFTTELHKRLSLAVACLSLIFISIPLAIKAHRSEKTIGMALSLALIFFFYIFIAYADAVADNYKTYPYLIVWIPNILFIGFGTLWMVKFSRI